MSPHFKPICRHCEQIERNKRKNEDRALAIIDGRAADRARRLGVPKSVIWIDMNWCALVAPLRAMMSPEGRCLNCGHPFVNERDIQIEHQEPPRYEGDWAREHTRNLALSCQSCNGTKGRKPFAEWLDEQESARISNERHPAISDLLTPRTEPAQASMFDMWGATSDDI